MKEMKKKVILTALLTLAMGTHAQTLEECQRAAEQNYPLIKQYELIAQTTNLTTKNIQKGWLPQIGLYGQTTYQSDVTEWHERMKGMFQQLGIQMEGLKRLQYKAGIDIQQTIYDGGAQSTQSRIAREQGKVQEIQNEVNLYNVRKRVNELYFSLLMLDQQIKLNDDMQALLMQSEKQLTDMLKSGTAANSDVENMKAERLNAAQQNMSMQSQRKILCQLLSVFCGIEVTRPQKPAAINHGSSSILRPEMKLFDAQLKLADAEEKAINAALMPKLGAFVQGYYGYPSLNMFKDMIQQKWSLNGLIGIKLSWSIGALYTRKNEKAKLQMQRALTENRRSLFLFNNKLEQIQQQENITRYRQMMQSDNEIILLKSSVRKAAESKLAHGIIDTTALLREINSENAARTQQAIHEVEMLKEMYNLKYTVND